MVFSHCNLINKNSIFSVVKYNDSQKLLWNNFIAKAKNATFLFNRDFMDYHQDRFDDFSLLVFKEDKLIAVLPANIKVNAVYSHQGLSYGGFIVLEKIRVEDYVLAFKALLIFIKKQKIHVLYLKKLPFIYHKNLSNELDYVLSIIDAKTHITDSYFVIDNPFDYNPNRNRSRALRLAKKNEVKISNIGIEFFWKQILVNNLQTKFNVNPIHSIDEIKLLTTRFPEQIKFFAATINGAIKAGVVMFLSDNVAHFQYSSGDESRNETAALDFLFHTIIKQYSNKKYISFGSSSTDKTLKIDRGLMYWKESFGAKLIPQKVFSINTKNHELLNTIFK